MSLLSFISSIQTTLASYDQKMDQYAKEAYQNPIIFIGVVTIACTIGALYASQEPEPRNIEIPAVRRNIPEIRDLRHLQQNLVVAQRNFDEAICRRILPTDNLDLWQRLVSYLPFCCTSDAQETE